MKSGRVTKFGSPPWPTISARLHDALVQQVESEVCQGSGSELCGVAAASTTDSRLISAASASVEDRGGKV